MPTPLAFFCSQGDVWEPRPIARSEVEKTAQPDLGASPAVAHFCHAPPHGERWLHNPQRQSLRAVNKHLLSRRTWMLAVPTRPLVPGRKSGLDFLYFSFLLTLLG